MSERQGMGKGGGCSKALELDQLTPYGWNEFSFAMSHKLFPMSPLLHSCLVFSSLKLAVTSERTGQEM